MRRFDPRGTFYGRLPGAYATSSAAFRKRARTAVIGPVWECVEAPGSSRLTLKASEPRLTEVWACGQ